MSIVMLLAIIFVIGIPVCAFILVILLQKSKKQESFSNSKAFTAGQDINKNLPDSQTGNDMNMDPQGHWGAANEKKQLSTISAEKPDIERMIDERRMERAERSAGFCSRCGSPIQQSDIFCPGCGEKVSR